MAFLLQDDDDQNQQQQIASPQGSTVIGTGGNENQGNQNQFAGSQAGAGGGSQVGGATQPSQAPLKSSDQKGTGFMNVQQYIDQNKNQAQGLAQKTANTITGKIDSAKSNVNQKANSFQNMVNQNTVNLNQDMASRAAENPYDFSQNQNDVAEFKKMYSGNYQGPQSFEGQDNFQDILQGINSAKNQAELSNTESGRTEILKSMQRNPTKSSGMAALDNLLLQTNSDASQTLKDASAGAFDLDNFLSSISGQQNQNVQNARTTNQQTGKALQEQFIGQGGVRDQFSQRLDNNVLNARSNATTKNQGIMDAVKGGQITPEQAQYLGLDAAQFADVGSQVERLDFLNNFFGDQNLLGEQNRRINLQDFISQNQTPEAAFTRQNVASQDDFARSQALSDLLGMDNNLLSEQDIGTANDDLIDFDLDNFKGDTNQKLKTREDALTRYDSLKREWASVENKLRNQQPVLAKSRNFNDYLKERGFSVLDSSLKELTKPKIPKIAAISM